MFSVPRLRTHYILKKKKLIQSISLRKGYGYTPYVILCAPRTGSTLLHTCLNSHPKIISQGEVLRISLEKQGGTALPPLKEWIYKAQPLTIRALGLKLFYRYETEEGFSTAFREVLENPEIKVIHLIRKELRNMYVSLKLAEKTGVWNDMKVAQKKDLIPLHLPLEEFRSFCEGYIGNCQRVPTFFRAHDMLTISYEDLISRQNEVLHQVQSFLNVTPKPLFSLLKKQNPEAFEELVSNHREINQFYQENYASWELFIKKQHEL